MALASATTQLSRRDFLRLSGAGIGAATLARLGAFGAAGVPGFASSAEPAFAFSTETQAFFDRLLTPPDDTRAGHYDDLVNSLVAAGVWARLDGLWVYAAADGGTSLLNLVSSRYRATANVTAGRPAFAKDKGWTGTGINANIHTGFTPLTSEGHLAQDDACMFCWNLTALSTHQMVMGISDPTPAHSNLNERVCVWPEPDGTTYFALNSAACDTVKLRGDSSGFWLVNRTAAAALTLDHNGSRVAATSTPSAAYKGGPFIAPWGAQQVALCGIGAALTGEQRATLHGACQTYLHAIGAL